MLMVSCRFKDEGDAAAGILSSVEAADLPVHRWLPKPTCSAISATFIARLNKGCRGDDCAGLSEKIKA
jgi:hypothetical protein